MAQNKHGWLIAIPAIIVIGLIGVVIYQGIHQQTDAKQSNKINVVASLDSYGEMAQAVLGNQGSVTSIIADPDVDPHEFEPTTADAKIYQKADVIISNGGGFDDWSVRFAKQNEQAKSINLANIYHYTDDSATGNEHFWYKTDVAQRLTKRLVQQYAAIEPDKRAYFQKNANRYIKSLDHVFAMQRQVKVALQGKKLMATEPVFNNTLFALGATVLDQSFAQAVDEQQDPTPAAIRAWHQAIDDGQVAAVIYNPQSTGKLVDQAKDYAKEHGVAIVEARETRPTGKTYAEWQYTQLKALDEALKK